MKTASNYQLPDIDLLNIENQETLIPSENLEATKDKILQTLNNYGIEFDKIKATIGPAVTLFEIVPSAGVRISKIKNLEDDIALSLSALGIRIIVPVPGTGSIGIEVPNTNRDTVSMRSMLASEKFQNAKMDLPIALGKTIGNESFIVDLVKMPHIFIGGAEGQGKSVCINSILLSLLYKKQPSEIKFVLVDMQKVELREYDKIEKHFIAKLPGGTDAIITDTKEAVNALNSLCLEMDARYDLLKEARVRNIKEYNSKVSEDKRIPYIIVVIDEFADLKLTEEEEFERPLARLAQLARAIGIHLIIATQRPSVNVITGVIKANFPDRVAFRTKSRVDSRTILDSSGADTLTGCGDALFSTGYEIIRLQCAFPKETEIKNVCDFIASQDISSGPYLLPGITD